MSTLLEIDPAFFHNLVEYSSDGIILHNIDKILYMNRAAANLLGVGSPGKFVGKHMREFLCAKEFRMMNFITESILEQGKKIHIVDQDMICINGENIHIEWKVTLVEYHKEPAFQIIIKDITERKTLEKTLLQHEEKYRIIVENSNDLISILDANACFNYVSPSFKKILGYEQESLLGISAFHLTHPEDIPKLKNTFQQMIETKAGGMLLYRCKHQSGKWFIIEANRMPVFDENGLVYIVIVGRDVTEQKNTEKKILESEKNLRTLIHAIPDFINFKDGDGRWIEANHMAQRIFQLEGVAFRGKKDTELAEFIDVSYDTLLACETSDDMVFQTGQTVRTEEKIKINNHQTLIFDVTKVPMFHEDGSRKGLVVFGRDITEHLKTEESLRKSEKLSVVGQLAAGVAHEIRNPLTSLKGFIQLLAENESNKKYCDIMISELNRVNEIVSEFLSIAKPQVKNFKEKNICTVLKEVVQLLSAQAHLKNIEIVLHCEMDFAFVFCDENQLKQVFVNILKNAIESIIDHDSKIIVHVKKDPSNYLLIQIVDFGIGISPERIQKLGEPFYTTKEKGTGLGLMVSYKIIETHGGEIKIHSEVGKGTTVDIRLPYQSKY